MRRLSIGCVIDGLVMFSVIRRDIGQVVGCFQLSDIAWTEFLGYRLSKTKFETAVETRDIHWYCKYNMFPVQWNRSFRLMFVLFTLTNNTKLIWHVPQHVQLRRRKGQRMVLADAEAIGHVINAVKKDIGVMVCFRPFRLIIERIHISWIALAISLYKWFNRF